MTEKSEYKFEYQWGGEDTWYTKSKRFANKQKPPLNKIILGIIEWLWKIWIEGKVQLEMASVDIQVEEIHKLWDENKSKPLIKIEPSKVEGLDIISITNPLHVK